MSRSFWASRLEILIIGYVLFSILCSFFLFFILKFSETEILKAKFHNVEFIQKMTKNEVYKFSRFVLENNISTTDYKNISNWVKSKQDIIITIYKDDKVVFDSTVREFKPPKNDGRFKNNDFYRPLYDVEFSDGTAKIELFYFWQNKYINIFNYVNIVLSFVCFLIIFLFLIKKRTDYINLMKNEINILEGGNLEYNITIKGNDELTYLAKSIDDMRKSLAERFSVEKNSRNNNHKLVTSMSHDLRTPLTVLIGFLEILNGKKYADKEKQDYYIYKSLEKAYQIKNLSDKLFEYFLAYNLESEELNIETFDISVINEMIEEFIFTMSDKGFKIKYNPILENGKIMLDTQFIQRLFDNIFSNMIKYADKNKTINIYTTVREDTLFVSFKNIISSQISEESTNIGLEVCKKIAEGHGGSFYTENKGNLFITVLKLIIIKR